MKTIEYLFPEVANLYGDVFNVKYLEKSIKDVNVINTALTDMPAFTYKDVDMIYMGSMSERAQEIVIEKLRPYTKKLKELIDKGTVILFTGNAFEVLLDHIEQEDGRLVEGLGIIPAMARLDLKHRYNTLFLGELNIEDENKENKALKIVGHKATFSFTYGDNSKFYAFKSIKGCGINKDSNLEGFRINNLFATYLIGPLLVLNPEFTKYLMSLIGVNSEVEFEELAMECYKKRLEEFERESTNYLQ